MTCTPSGSGSKNSFGDVPLHLIRLYRGSLAFLGPRQSRGPGSSNVRAYRIDPQTLGGLRFSAKRPTVTATRMASGNKDESY